MAILSKKKFPIFPILLLSSTLNAASLVDISLQDELLSTRTFRAISGNGKILVGANYNEYRWESGIFIEKPRNVLMVGSSVSYDGSIIVGDRSYPNEIETQATRCINSRCILLGKLGVRVGGAESYISSANGVSEDGSVVVGSSPSDTRDYEPFIWTEVGGMKPLISLPSVYETGLASGISSNGTIIAGTIRDGVSKAFRYTVNNTLTGTGTYELLGTLRPDGTGFSEATGISADGSTIVGRASSPNGVSEAFRIGVTGRMEGLGILPGAFATRATATSADGSIVVGESSINGGHEVFIWDALNGIRKLTDVLRSLGVSTSGWDLNYVYDISDDGTKILGIGSHNSNFAAPWIADLSTGTINNTNVGSSSSDSDFNNDGKGDILWRNSVTGENGAYLMNGANIASVGSINTLSDTNWIIAGVGDFDNDTKEDILWRNQSTGENMIYLMEGVNVAIQNAIMTVADTNWAVAGVGDFNNDGFSDILWFNSVTGETYIFLMNGFTISALQQSITAPANWIPVGVGDFDKDRKSDILWRNSVSGENYVLLMNGLNIASQGSITTVADTNWSVAGIGDFDNDEKSDVLWRNSATGETYIFLMDGIGTKSMGSLVTVGDLNWRPVHVADFNGDNKADVFWRNSITGQNWMLQLNGISISLSQAVSTVGDLNWKVNGD